MPHSDTSTHEHMLSIIDMSGKKSLKILDCGVGSGMIGQAISTLDKTVEIHGIEIFGPYIQDTEMMDSIKADHSMYKAIQIGNMANILESIEEKKYDIVIFGDSLEHLHSDWAEHCLGHALRVTKKYVIVNMPKVKLEQGSVNGNEWETHRLNWNGTQLEYWGAKLVGGSSVVGCYLFDKVKLKKTYDHEQNYPKTKSQQKIGGNRFDDNGKATN